MRHQLSSCSAACWILSAAILLAAILLITPCVSAQQRDADSAPSEAEALVKEALQAEIAGDSASREALLERALAVSPDYAPANWHLGRVHDGNRWRSVDEVTTSWATDQRLLEYRERRMQCLDTVEDQLHLANWCRDRGLTDEERIHLMKVVELKPDHAVVFRRLGMRRYQDRWLYEDEIEQLERTARQVELAVRRFKPVLAKLRRQIEEGDAESREDALRRFYEISDPEAFPVMEVEFSEQSEDLGLETVKLLGIYSRQEATESLLRHAVFCRFEEVRDAACLELENRAKYNYISTLVNAFAPTGEVIVEFPLGTNALEVQTFHLPGSDYNLKWEHTISRVPGRRGRWKPRPVAIPKQVTPLYVNDSQKQLDLRIRAVLSKTTGLDYRSPSEWRGWWQDYCEYELPLDTDGEFGEKPVYVFSSTEQQEGKSCLAWGTPVWTVTGAVNVEKIRVGDRALCQDPQTGELAYKPVLKTTIRRPGTMRKICFGDESITVTLGHPFWVIGEGWRMAKHLDMGDRVHCLAGSVEVTGIEELPADVAYNLVVEDFNTYFAGESRALLHDNLPPRPTDALVPGLSHVSQTPRVPRDGQTGDLAELLTTP